MNNKSFSINNDRIIIGLTGSFGSGSSTVANYLKEKDYRVVSVAKEILEPEALKRGYKEDEISRKVLQDVGNLLRKEDIENNGNGGIIIRKTLEILESEKCDKKIIINSIKNPLEIKEIKKFSNAYILAIDSSRQERWSRVLTSREYSDFSQFEIDDARDKNEGLEYGQKVQRCVDLADIVLNNEDPFTSNIIRNRFFTKVEQYIKILIDNGFRTPTNMELLMNNAYNLSLMSECVKRQVGAVITKQEQREHETEQMETYKKKEYFYIISCGFNDVPIGEYSCAEEHSDCYRNIKKSEIIQKIKYCPECGKTIVDYKCSNSNCKYYKNEMLDNLLYGKGLDVCRALHAEEKAILQVAYLGGSSLKGATIYTTTFPCLLCAKKIIACGIEEVVYVEPYPMQEAKDILNEANVTLTKFEGVKSQSFYKLFNKI